MKVTGSNVLEVQRVLEISEQVLEHNLSRLNVTEDEIVETMRQHFMDEGKKCLCIISGPNEEIGPHIVAGFGMRMGFLRPDAIDRLSGSTIVEMVLTTKGENILSIGTMLKTGTWPDEGGGEPPKRIINVRRRSP